MKACNETIKSRRTPSEFLRELFEDRKERNNAYSISAFSRDLGVSVSILSRVMIGERPMSLKFGLQVSTALGLNEKESNALIYSLVVFSSKKAKISNRVRQKIEKDYLSQNISNESSPLFTTVEVERFKAISKWYHLAILNLLTLDEFIPTISFIAKALEITSSEAKDAIDRLISLGLVEEKDGNLTRTKKHFYVRTQKSEFGVRKFHEQMIAKSVENLNKTDDESFHKRLINGITFSCGPEHIEAVKDKILQLQNEVIALTQTGSATTVYQMNVQFFPLSKTQNQVSLKGESQ